MEEEKSNATSLIPFNSDERKVDFRLKKCKDALQIILLFQYHLGSFSHT